MRPSGNKAQTNSLLIGMAGSDHNHHHQPQQPTAVHGTV